MGLKGAAKVVNPEHANETFITPPALCTAAIAELPHMQVDRILDPGCATGNWGRAAAVRWPAAQIVGVDIRDIEWPEGYTSFIQEDFREFACNPFEYSYDLVIGNPPFSLAVPFIRGSLNLLRPGGRVVFVLEMTYLASQERYFVRNECPIEHFFVLPERPSFTEDGKTAAGREYGIFYFRKGKTSFNDRPSWDYLDWSGKLGEIERRRRFNQMALEAIA